jgi:hypothetical protein
MAAMPGTFAVERVRRSCEGQLRNRYRPNERGWGGLHAAEGLSRRDDSGLDPDMPRSILICPLRVAFANRIREAGQETGCRRGRPPHQNLAATISRARTQSPGT